MSSAQPSTEQSPVTSEATKQQLFSNCMSCRLVSGGGLFAAGAYVYMQARKTMRLGAPTSFGTVFQIAFAAGEMNMCCLYIRVTERSLTLISSVSRFGFVGRGGDY